MWKLFNFKHLNSKFFIHLGNISVHNVSDSRSSTFIGLSVEVKSSIHKFSNEFFTFNNSLIILCHLLNNSSVNTSLSTKCFSGISIEFLKSKLVNCCISVSELMRHFIECCCGSSFNVNQINHTVTTDTER